jgi:hypothetical protein
MSSPSVHLFFTTEAQSRLRSTESSLCNSVSPASVVKETLVFDESIFRLFIVRNEQFCHFFMLLFIFVSGFYPKSRYPISWQI